MVLPDNWKLFRSLVLEKIKTYCGTGIWPIDFEKVTAWLGNFKECEEDEYVALHFLDSLIVRSSEMAVSGYGRLLRSDIRQHLIEKGVIDSNQSIDNWMRLLKLKSSISKFQFHPVKSESENGESGSTLFRKLSCFFRSDLMPNNIDQNSKNIVYILIDDFLGGGDQFLDFFNDSKIKDVLVNNTVIYAPLIAYAPGLERVKRRCEKLDVLPVEIIGSEDSIFFSNPKNKNYFRNDTQNSVSEVVLHYQDMKSRYASEYMPYWCGRDDAGLTLAFEWGSPNQSCSVLWMEDTPKNNNWHQLFRRRS